MKKSTYTLYFKIILYTINMNSYSFLKFIIYFELVNFQKDELLVDYLKLILMN